MSKESKIKQSTEQFTLDSTRSTEMPSVSRLLNRKTLDSTKAPPPSHPSNAPPREITLSLDPHLEESTPPPVTPSPARSITQPTSRPIDRPTTRPTTRPMTKKETPPHSPLISWDLRVLQAASDPLGKGIAQLFQKGAQLALFLAVQPILEGVRVPHFLSTAYVGEKKKVGIWTGLKWDPAITPEMWNHFVRTGFVELTPPGTMTVLTSSRNVVRAAFGIQPEEWLLLVRAGPANSCRGVVAFVSIQSLLADLPTVLPLLSATSPASPIRY